MKHIEELLLIVILSLATLVLGGACLVNGCASASTNTFRAEQAAVEVAYAGYGPYTNWLLTSLSSPDLSPDRRQYLLGVSNSVKQARLRFAATVYTVESMRVAYETNSALKPQLDATLTTLNDQASNLCWLIQYWKSQ